jgi:hypothetical protein
MFQLQKMTRTPKHKNWALEELVLVKVNAEYISLSNSKYQDKISIEEAHTSIALKRRKQLMIMYR